MPEIPKTETLIISWDSNHAHPISLTKEEISAAANVPNAAGDTPTAAEFNALLNSLRYAGILKTS